MTVTRSGDLQVHELVGRWLLAVFAAIGAAVVGTAAPGVVFRLTGCAETFSATTVCGAFEFHGAAFCAVGAACVAAPGRPILAASLVFMRGALYGGAVLSVMWYPPPVEYALFLSGCLGGVSAIASGIAVRRLRARVHAPPRLQDLFD